MNNTNSSKKVIVWTLLIVVVVIVVGLACFKGKQTAQTNTTLNQSVSTSTNQSTSVVKEWKAWLVLEKDYPGNQIGTIHYFSPWDLSDFVGTGLCEKGTKDAVFNTIPSVPGLQESFPPAFYLVSFCFQKNKVTLLHSGVFRQPAPNEVALEVNVPDNVLKNLPQYVEAQEIIAKTITN